MKFKRLTTVFFAGVMLVTMAACGGGGETAQTSQTGNNAAADSGADTSAENGEQAMDGILQPNQEAGNTEKTDETLVIAVGSEPASLWHAATEGGMSTNEEQYVSTAILDRLVQVDPETNEVMPMLAESWEWVDDTHLKFTIRDGVKTASGATLTADDVVYTANIWKTNCATNDTGKYIVDAVAEGNTVTIEYNAVAPDILRMMAWGNYGIVSQADVEAVGGLENVRTNPLVGTGKYRFKEWKTAEYIVLERNEDYWDPDYSGYFKEIRLIFVGDSASRSAAVEAGDAQVAVNMPVNQAAAKAGQLRTYIYSFGQEQHLWYNMADGRATADENVRKAIDLALDFDAIAAVGTAGYGSPSLSYVSEDASYYTANYTDEERAVDLETARSLLEEAGITELTIDAIGLQEHADVITVIQGNLAQIGITVNPVISDTSTYVNAALNEKDYDLTLVGDNLTDRTPQLCQFWTGGMVIGGPNMPLDELVELGTALMEETDETKLSERAAAIDAYNKEHTICSNLYSELMAAVTAPDIKGYSSRERGYVDITAFYK